MKKSFFFSFLLISFFSCNNSEEIDRLKAEVDSLKKLSIENNKPKSFDEKIERKSISLNGYVTVDMDELKYLLSIKHIKEITVVDEKYVEIYIYPKFLDKSPHVIHNFHQYIEGPQYLLRDIRSFETLITFLFNEKVKFSVTNSENNNERVDSINKPKIKKEKTVQIPIKRPKQDTENSSKEELTQEESSEVHSISNNSETNNESDLEKPKDDFTNLFGKGSGNDGIRIGLENGDGVGSGPNNGGGFGNGKNRLVIGNPELDNPKNWEGYVMVQFTIDKNGNVINAKVLYPHEHTSISLTSVDRKLVENDCKKKFKFTSISSGPGTDRFTKRIQYINQ